MAVAFCAVAWWAFDRAVQRRVEEVVGGGTETVVQDLAQVHISAERTLTPIQPGETEHLCLGDVRRLLAGGNISPSLNVI